MLETHGRRGRPSGLPLRRRQRRPALRLRAAVEGTPFERFLRSARTEIELDAPNGGDRGDDGSERRAARALAAWLTHDAKGDPAHAERRARTDWRRRRPGRRASALTAQMKWWGWGDPDRRLELPATARRGACATSSAVASGDASEPVSLESGLAAPSRACPRTVRCRGRRGPRRAGRPRPPRGRAQLSRPRPPAHREARARPGRRAQARGRRRAVEAIWRPARAAGVAVVPYRRRDERGRRAWTRSRAGHGAVVSLDLGRLRCT